MNGIRFFVSCTLCLGRGTIGTSTLKQPCPECAGRGGHVRDADALTPEQATEARLTLATAPVDAAEEYHASSTAENIAAVLSKRWIETTAIPEGDAIHIDLINSRGNAIRIFPEFRDGKFRNLNAIPVPPSP